MEDNKVDDSGYRINKAITAQQVRVVDQNGDAVGVLPIKDALVMAYEDGMDLVEISPQAQPPVCKITDYGKFKYEMQKKKSEAKKKQKVIEIKEVKLNIAIGAHDYAVKLNSIKRFIADGNKVKITLRFRGRELSHQDLGIKLIQKVIDDVKDIAKNENTPSLEGRQIMVLFAPVNVK